MYTLELSDTAILVSQLILVYDTEYFTILYTSHYYTKMSLEIEARNTLQVKIKHSIR